MEGTAPGKAGPEPKRGDWVNENGDAEAGASKGVRLRPVWMRSCFRNAYPSETAIDGNEVAIPSQSAQICPAPAPFLWDDADRLANATWVQT